MLIYSLLMIFSWFSQLISLYRSEQLTREGEIVQSYRLDTYVHLNIMFKILNNSFNKI